MPKMRIFGILGYFVVVRYFSWKFRVGPFRGSVTGRGVLNVGGGLEGQEQENPGFGKPWFSYLMPLFFLHWRSRQAADCSS